MLLVLTLLSAMNQLDRQLVNILIEPIRQEFALSDVQIGLLSGLAFAIIFSLLSIPAALYVVNNARKPMLAVSAFVWGGMTVASGFAQSYGHLIAARLGVGLGEAGGMPPAHAMISDRFAPNERASAMATWASGVNAGIFLAFLGGGLIGQLYGWRTAFICAGVLTILVAAVLQLTVRESALLGARGRARSLDTAVLLSFLRILSADRALMHVFAGATLAALLGYSLLAWAPSFFIRSHDLTVAEAGIYIAATAGALGAVGTWFSGYLTERLQRRDIRWALWLSAAILIAIAPLAVGAFLAGSAHLSMALFAVSAAFGTAFVGPSIAILHNRVDPQYRPVASAVLLLVVNCIGLLLGPLGVGALSQYAFSSQGVDSLRYALVTVELVSVWAACHFLWGGSLLAQGKRTNFASGRDELSENAL